MATLLGKRRARTLYNLADAVLPAELARAADGASLDVLPELERGLRHEGLPRIRRVWLLLWLVDWAPLLLGPRHRRFFRLARADRRACLERLRALPGLAGPLQALDRRIADAARATAARVGGSAPCAAHSLEGA